MRGIKSKSFWNSKKGVSVIIGYVLLVAIAVVISVVTYNWMKTYVPKDSYKCPDGVSLFVEDSSCSDSDNQLNLTIKNNGRFDLRGFYVKATENLDVELATIDLAPELRQAESDGVNISNAVYALPLTNNNPFESGESLKFSFNFAPTDSYIEIIPIRYQNEDGKMRTVSCGNPIREKVHCD